MRWGFYQYNLSRHLHISSALLYPNHNLHLLLLHPLHPLQLLTSNPYKTFPPRAQTPTPFIAFYLYSDILSSAHSLTHSLALPLNCMIRNRDYYKISIVKGVVPQVCLYPGWEER